MMQWQNVNRKNENHIESGQSDTKKKKILNRKIVQRLLGEESADYRDNKHKHKPASVYDDQMNNRAAAVLAGKEYPHENNKLYKKRLTIAEGKRKCWTKFFDSFPYHCVLWAAGGPLGKSNDGGKLNRMTYEWRQLLREILLSSLRLGGIVAVRVNKIPLNLIDESESSQKRQHRNDFEDWRRRLRWVFPFLAIVFKVYNFPHECGNRIACIM